MHKCEYFLSRSSFIDIGRSGPFARGQLRRPAAGHIQHSAQEEANSALQRHNHRHDQEASRALHKQALHIRLSERVNTHSDILCCFVVVVLENPKRLKYSSKWRQSKATVDQLEQFYLLTPSKVKDAYLFHLLKEYTEKHARSSVIVFTNTCRSVCHPNEIDICYIAVFTCILLLLCRNCQILALMARKFNIPCVEIHSMMKQTARIASLANFKSSQIRVLFATDVASR